MCLHRVLVIVIVKSWDGRGARFKYINVRGESTMVARLPQQVFLLLVLVTSTTTRTGYEPGLSNWTTAGSAIRRGPSSTRSSSSPTSIDEQDSSGSGHSRSLLVSRNGFGERFQEAGIKVSKTETANPRNLRLERGSSIPEIDSSSYERQDFKSRDRNTHGNKQADRRNVRLELPLKTAKDLEDHDERTSGRVQDIRRTPPKSIDDRPFGHYSTPSDELVTTIISPTSSVSIPSMSNDFPTSGTSGRSPRVETRQPEDPGHGKATRSSSSPTSIDGQDSSGSGHSRSLLVSRNGFGERFQEAGIKVSKTETANPRNLRLERGSSIPEIDSSSYERQDFKPRDRNTHGNKQADRRNVRLELPLKTAKDLEDHDERTSGRVQDTRRTPPNSIDDRPFGHYSTPSDELVTTIISPTSSVSIPSMSNDFPTSGTSGRSPRVESRHPQSPGYPKATPGTLSPSDIIARPSKRTQRLDHGFPNVGLQLRGKESTKFGADGSDPLNSVIAAEGMVGVEGSSLVPKAAGMEDGQANVRVITSVNLHDPSSAKSEEEEGGEAKFPKDSSPDRIMTRSIPGEFNTFKTPEKFETYESPTRGLGLTLAQEEALEISSWRFDVPPPDSLYLPYDRRSLADEMGEIHSTGSKYDRRKIDWLTPEREQIPETTLPTTSVGFPKRYMREVPESVVCEKFEVGEPDKREFYSPYYPQNYPPLANCVRVLEAEKGMLLKLDFRDNFELEPMMPVNDKVGECRFDYLEVRDGQYGFSTLLGIFCDKNFPPEIISKSRYLWLHFHSDDTIEYRGFKAVWSTVARPNISGIPDELDPCIRHVHNLSEVIVSSDDVQEEKKKAERYGVALDCLWIIQARPTMKMQLSFDTFKLERPNDCGSNFLDVFGETTDVPSRLKNFCGSIAEPVNTKTNTLYIRLYLELKAINSSFKSLITSIRERGSTDKPCRADEYDCDDSTCIALSLRCNGRHNCRFQRDEDPSMCGTTADKFDSSRVIIILVIFSLIMFGMCSAFIFNCVRKLRRDHRIIREHIRQSRENRLDEIGRRATPCPVSVSRTDLRDRGSESPSVEVDSSKELIPTATLIAPEYTNELDLETKYINSTREINDIHQSNNVSNATQERLQESSEEPEMCDSSCQTRESLFDPRIPEAALPSPEFSTFGYRSLSGSQNGVAPSDRGATHQSHRYRQHPRQPSRGPSQQSHGSQPSSSPPSRHPVSERCSACVSPPSLEGALPVCPRHNPIPAPPGWSLNDPPYPPIVPGTPVPKGPSEYTTYRRYQSPKPERAPSTEGVCYQQHRNKATGFPRQNTVGSGERYGSFFYGSERASSNTGTSNTTTSSEPTGTGSQHSATPKYTQADPRYRAEAVIEVDQKRPFSIESTKSAPDVIATH